MVHDATDWAAIRRDPRFRLLQRRKARFLAFLMLAALIWFFALPLGAAFHPEFFRLPVAGAVNVGILLALSEFVMVWLVAALYLRRSTREFDRLAVAINTEILAHGRLRESP